MVILSTDSFGFSRREMKHLLITTIAAVVLVGCATLVKDTGSTEEEAKKVLIDFLII
jgi:hypothetical protein